MSDHLHSERHGSTQVLTIDRPAAKNALHGPLRAALCDALATADRDDAVRAIVLTATDPVFSAGVDYKLLDATACSPAVNPAAAARAVRKPVICAVNGACVSGALELALSCSFIVASEQARFADTHALLGVVPTWGLTALLPRAIGVRAARQMSVTGAFVDAATALRLGLVNEVVPHANLLPFALELAECVPASTAVGEMLGLYADGMELSLADALAAEAAHSRDRVYDLDAFSAAGTATAARQRHGDQHFGKEQST